MMMMIIWDAVVCPLYAATDASGERIASIFTINKTRKFAVLVLLCPKYEDVIILLNFVHY